MPDFKGISTTSNRGYIEDNISEINEKLKAFPIEERAAILGTIIEESGGNPFAKNDSGAYQGLLQWGADRYRPASLDESEELDNQTRYIQSTINNPQGGVNWTHGGKGSNYMSGKEAYDTFKNKDLPFKDRYRAFSYGYVRPKGKEDSYNNRLNVARKVLNNLVVNEVLSKPKPKKWVPKKFEKRQYNFPIKYDEGGSLGNGWDSLSYKEKAEMMKVAVENGITALPEIREAYDKYAEEGDTDNQFAKGGYAPSKKLQQDIATWEGSEMKRNRPFGEMTQQFNSVVPKELQDRLSTNQLDALYSYGYNVGMGNLKERVLPTLSAYTQGKATREDVQRSMWASRDNELRGLTRRRNWERGLFGGSYRTEFTGKGNVERPKVTLGVQVNPEQYEIPDAFFDGFNRQINDVQMPQMKDPATLYKPVVVDDTLFAKAMPVREEPVYDPMEEKRQGLRNFLTVMGMQDGGLFSGLSNKEDGRLGLMEVVKGIYG